MPGMTFAVRSPSTAILVFEVTELDLQRGRQYPIGNFAAPLSGIRGGIRWVPLWAAGSMDASPTAYGSLCGLLVHVHMQRVKHGTTSVNLQVARPLARSQSNLSNLST